MRFADELAQAAVLVKDKLFFSVLKRADSLKVSSIARKSICFSIDNELIYEPFFADFGPLNLGLTYRFCEKTSALLKEGERLGQNVYFCCGAHPHQVANAAVLAGLYQVMILGRSADEAMRPLERFKPFVPFRDASCGVSTFHLTVEDCLKGMQRARDAGIISFTNNTFDVQEYLYYEQVEHGDLNWILPGKFVAFSGPSSRRTEFHGYRTLIPEDYIDYYKHKGVTGVVRLNKKSYDRRRFTESGLHHYDLYFPDGSCPPDSILRQFLEIAESEPGALAVHCKAGLGRTGVLICSYLMKHYGFTAEEVVGYIRICRPGSVIGPQQHYLQEMQARMFREGELFRQRQAAAAARTHEPSSRGSSAGSDRVHIKDIPEVDRRTSPMKPLRSGTKPTNISSVTKQMGAASLGANDRLGSRGKAGAGAEGLERPAGSFLRPSFGAAAPTGSTRRAAAVAASSPAFLPPRRDHNLTPPAPSSGTGVRHSMPTFGGNWGSSSSQPPSRGTPEAAEEDIGLPTGFHITPGHKPSSVTRTLAPNGQPRKMPAALASGQQRAGGSLTSAPTSTGSSRYSSLRSGITSSLNRNGRR